MDTRSYLMLQETFALVACMGGLGWVIYMGVGLLKRKQQQAIQKYALDKFSSAQDFSQFVQSPAGQKYLASLSEAVTNPRNAILNSIKTGCVVMFGGMGFLVGGAGSDSISFRIGWVLLLVGVGFLLSAGISYFLVRKVGWKDQD
jgi:hypothetical protein